MLLCVSYKFEIIVRACEFSISNCFSDLTMNSLQTFESAVQDNVSINGQAWQEASDNCLKGM